MSTALDDPHIQIQESCKLYLNLSSLLIKKGLEILIKQGDILTPEDCLRCVVKVLEVMQEVINDESAQVLILNHTMGLRELFHDKMTRSIRESLENEEEAEAQSGEDQIKFNDTLEKINHIFEQATRARLESETVGDTDFETAQGSEFFNRQDQYQPQKDFTLTDLINSRTIYMDRSFLERDETLSSPEHPIRPKRMPRVSEFYNDRTPSFSEFKILDESDHSLPLTSSPDKSPRNSLSQRILSSVIPRVSQRVGDNDFYTLNELDELLKNSNFLASSDSESDTEKEDNHPLETIMKNVPHKIAPVLNRTFIQATSEEKNYESLEEDSDEVQQELNRTHNLLRNRPPQDLKKTHYLWNRTPPPKMQKSPNLSAFDLKLRREDQEFLKQHWYVQDLPVWDQRQMYTQKRYQNYINDQIIDALFRGLPEVVLKDIFPNLTEDELRDILEEQKNIKNIQPWTPTEDDENSQ